MSEPINDIYNTFNIYSKNLLKSNPATFAAHLNTFVDFCNNTSIIQNILEPIKNCSFNGLQYFIDQGNNSYPITEPKDHIEMLKIAYDCLWSDNLNMPQINSFVTFGLRINTHKNSEALEVFNTQITTLLINHICSNLEKYIDITPPFTVTQYQIDEVNNSIVGNQTNATLNNNLSDNTVPIEVKPKSKFEIFAEKHKHKIYIALGIITIIVTIIIFFLTPQD